MMKTCARVVFLFLVYLPSVGVCQAPRRPDPAQVHAKFLPPKGKVLVFVDGAHNDPGIRSWRDITGTEPSGFVSWMIDANDSTLWFFKHQASPDNHAVLVFLDFKGKWDEVIDGKQDERLEQIGDAIKESRRPVFVILGHEFDLDGKNDPKKYVAYFRHVHDGWERLGVENVAYVWHAVTGFGEGAKAWEYYPGDRYCDWFGVSFYHVGNNPAAAKFAACARRRGKPLMLCESGPLNKPEFLDKWSSWYGPYMRFIREQDVRAIMYWPGNPEEPAPQPGGFGGGSLHRLRPAIREGFVREVQKPSFLKGEVGLFEVLGYKP